MLTLLSTTLILVLVGCQDQKRSQERPIWEHTKITDLLPPDGSATLNLREVTFEVFIIEIPADDQKTISDIQRLLHAHPINFNNPEVFAKNNFAAGFNRIAILDRLNEILGKTNSRRLRNISILIPAEMENQIYAKKILTRQNIQYFSQDGSLEAITAGPGDIILELKVGVLDTHRGICRLYAKPAFLPPMIDPISKLAELRDNRKFYFEDAGFNVNMSFGDIIVLTPVEYIDHQRSLGSLFFCDDKDAATQRIYVIICSRVNF